MRQRWYRSRAQFESWIEGGEFKLAKDVRLHVPVRCDGQGSVHLASSVSLGFRKAPMLGNGMIVLQARTNDASISIGEKTTTSNNITIIAMKKVVIGSRCLIGERVTIIDSDFHEISPEKRHEGSGMSEAVIIGDNVWLGSGVQILKGVIIGEGSVVAAGSVVTKSFPARSLIAGVPAKCIRTV